MLIYQIDLIPFLLEIEKNGSVIVSIKLLSIYDGIIANLYLRLENMQKEVDKAAERSR